jgi:hypothetical protein
MRKEFPILLEFQVRNTILLSHSHAEKIFISYFLEYLTLFLGMTKKPMPMTTTQPMEKTQNDMTHERKFRHSFLTSYHIYS